MTVSTMVGRIACRRNAIGILERWRRARKNRILIQTLVTLLLFLGHATCSVTLILLNKEISLRFKYVWTVIWLQNL